MATGRPAAGPAAVYGPEPAERGMLRQTLRRFLDQECSRDAVRRWDAEDRYPREAVARLGALGVFGLTTPAEHGGAGPDLPAAIVTVEELARRCHPVAVAYVMGAFYAAINLTASGSPAQRQALLPRVAAGQLLFAYGLSEPDVGADLASVTTTAERRGDRLTVTGAKRWCTGADVADYILTLVRSDRAGPRYRNLSLLLIDRRAPGVSMQPIRTLGYRGVQTLDVTFDGVSVPLDDILGGPDMLHRGWTQVAGPVLDVEKIEVSGLCLGLAQAAFEDAWEYAQTRHQFGKPIAAHQSLRHGLADMATELYAARLLVYHGAELLQQGRPCGVQTSMCKLFVAEAAARIVLQAQRVLGAYGHAMEYDVQRYLRDVLVYLVAGGSSAIQRNNIANRMGAAR